VAAVQVFAASMLAGADPGLPPSLLKLSVKELSEVKVDTVFAASKYDQKVTDAPSSVTIVTRDEIRLFGHRTLAEVIKGVRGFDVTNDRSYSYTGVRGFNSLDDYGSRVLLLVDGHRMADPIFDTSAVGTEGFLDVDLIERVEFVRGPGSAIYGSNAFFGVINVVTRRGADLNGAEASVTGGSFNAYSARLSYGKKIPDGPEVFLSVSTFATDGQKNLFFREFNRPETNHGIASATDGDRFWSTLAKVSLGDFTLEGGFVSRVKDIPTASYGTVFNAPHPQLDSRGYAELRYDHAVPGVSSINARAYFDAYDYYADSYVRSATAARKVFNHDMAEARWLGAELSLSRTLWDSLHVTAGAEVRKGTDLAMRNYNLHPFQEALSTHSDQVVVGTYADARWEMSQSLSLSSGVRWDHYDSFGSTVNPRAALVWKPLEDTSLKLLYGEAFRAPNIYQLYYNVLGYTANPGLRPETIRTYEVAAEHYFSHHWRSAVSLFRNEIKDLIQARGENGQTMFCNSGNAVVNGAEAEIEGKWGSGLLLRASYTYQEAEDTKTGWLVNSPRNIVKANIGVPLFREKLMAGLELQCVSERLTLRHDRTPRAVLLNFTLLSKEILPGVDISASIYNVLGQHYAIPGGPEHAQDQIAQDGRTFQVKLTYRF
jgi:iron complex outermembrane receptor protein